MHLLLLNSEGTLTVLRLEELVSLRLFQFCSQICRALFFYRLAWSLVLRAWCDEFARAKLRIRTLILAWQASVLSLTLSSSNGAPIDKLRVVQHSSNYVRICLVMHLAPLRLFVGFIASTSLAEAIELSLRATAFALYGVIHCAMHIDIGFPDHHRGMILVPLRLGILIGYVATQDLLLMLCILELCLGKNLFKVALVGLMEGRRLLLRAKIPKVISSIHESFAVIALRVMLHGNH